MERSARLRVAFGEIVRERRQAAGLSQEQLAEAAELHRNYIGLVERGGNNASLRAIDSLARALGARASDLVIDAERRAGIA